MTDSSSAPTTRLLVVMRHGKADSSAERDLDRHLTERGHGDAVSAGRWLAERDLVPERALVSAAPRAQETFSDVCEGLGRDVEAEVLDELYYASVEETLAAFSRVPSGVRAVLLIGHNPAMSNLAEALQSSGDEGAERAALDLPTAGIAVLDVAGDWDAMAPGIGQLRTTFQPGR